MDFLSKRKQRSKERRHLLKQLDAAMPRIIEDIRWNFENTRTPGTLVWSQIGWLPSGFSALAGTRVFQRRLRSELRKAKFPVVGISANYISRSRGEVGIRMVFFPPLITPRQAR